MKGFALIAALCDAYRKHVGLSGCEVVAEDEEGRVFAFTGAVRVKSGSRTGTKRAYVRVKEVRA